jgi:S-phase kinase-associated protein 1
MSSTPSSSCAKKITLRCSDGQTFEVEKAVAQKLLAIKRMIDDGFADDVIPLPNVTGPILARVINYHEKHGQTARPSDGSSVLPTSLDAAPQEQEIQEWDADFVNVKSGHPHRPHSRAYSNFTLFACLGSKRIIFFICLF